MAVSTLSPLWMSNVLFLCYRLGCSFVHMGTQWMPWRQGEERKGKRRASCIHKRPLTFLSKPTAQQKEQCLDPYYRCSIWGPALASFLLLSWSTLAKGNLKEKWFMSAPNSRLQSVAAGKPQPWELETPGHTTSIVKNEETCMCACSLACAQLNFPA